MGSARYAVWTRASAGAEPFALRKDVARILRVSLLSLLCGGIAVALITLVVRDWNGLVGAGCVTLVTPGLLWVMRRGHTRLAMTSAVSMLLIVACFEVIVGDGVHDVAMCLFTAVALVSGLLLDRLTSLAFSVLSVLSVALIGMAELTGYLRTPLSNTLRPGELAILVAMLAMLSLVIRVVTRALYDAIDDAALNEQAYREIFNATSDGILIHDIETGRIVDANESACTIAGFSRAELLTRSLGDMQGVGAGALNPGTVADLLQRAREGELLTFEWKVEHKDGRAVWLEIALRAAQIRGQQCALSDVRDISERKATAEQLRAAEGLKAIGQLAGGVAHDFNNQLTGIVANATLLKQRVRGHAASEACIEAILHCCNRSADLTRQLLAFARKGSRREEVLDVDALVREVGSLLEHGLDKRVVLELELRGEGACVVGDASFLSSALLNLGLNARDAMPQGGVLRLETRVLRHDELSQRERAQLPPSVHGYVRVRVRDSGIGIAPELLARIFEPFFTTKPQGHGLGLSAAYSTLHAHRGAILVDSMPGAGATFDLFLPATDRELCRPKKAPVSQPIPRLRVLLAEDEPVVGRATELLLQELGCAVTWCRDGREAVQVFERNLDAFDLLMLDHSMPHLLGSEVAERVAALRPQLPIIATSGYAEAIAAPATASKHIFLPKPFDADLLEAALSQALGHTEGTAERA